MAAPPVDVVRRAVERAIEIARADAAARPPVPPPVGLRPVLRFKRLPVTALATVAQVLDTDEDFRARVTAAVDRDEVGRAAWLWLSRPDGWEDDLAALVAELEVDVVPPTSEREADKALRRRVEGAERAATRAHERAERAEADLERSQRELRALRDAHHDLVARVDALDALAAQEAGGRRAAIADLKRVEGLLARRTEEKRALEQHLREVETRSLEADAISEDPLLLPHVDPEMLRRHLEAVDRRAAAFSEEVAALRALLGVTPPSPSPAPPRRPKRRAAKIPGGLTAESAQTAQHLVAQPGAVLLVDGYNITMYAWPDLDIAEQRSRLERGLADLVARTPELTVDLVFDGAEVLPLARTGARRARGITVRFTAPDVEADDALLELADRYPPSRPVLVASNDRRVRDGARKRGANVLSAAQLLAVARL
jgi:predicted RNA-binding protein with PIN domain